MSLPEFTDKELFHLALDSARHQRHDGTVRYLKALLTRQPEHSEAAYLLGAAYASLGMMEESEELLHQAVSLTPTMDIARFQLALVQLGLNKLGLAKEALQPLLDSSLNHYLNDYSRGIFALITENHSDAQRHLAQGIEKNKDNPALNLDMQGILEAIESGKIQKKLTDGDARPTNITEDADLLAADYLLGVYKQ